MHTTLAVTLALAISLMLAATAGAQNGATGPVATGYLSRTLKADGHEYKYVVYVPREYGTKPETKWPIILFMHGSGECGEDGWKQVVQGIGSAMLWDSAKWPFVVIFPQKPDVNKQWEDYDAPVMAMLAATEKEFSIDARRRYLTGLSQGGHGTWMFAENHPETWAAIAPICAYVTRKYDSAEPDASYAKLAQKIKGIPTWAFHGDADKSVPVGATKLILSELEKAHAPAKATYYPGVGHDSWTKAYRDENLGAWFLSHKRAD